MRIIAVFPLLAASLYAQAPVVIQPQDPVSASRAVINSNFSQLYNQVSGVVASTPSQVIFNNSGIVTGSNDLTWDNAGRRLGIAGPQPSPLPVGVYDLGRSVINGFPLSAEFQGTFTPTLTGHAGAVDGASSYPSTTALIGVAGYARTNNADASGGAAAVAVVGESYIGVDAAGGNATQQWGANFIVDNCAAPGCTDGQGFRNNNSYGVEIDVNMLKTAANLNAGNAQGLWITGASSHLPDGLADAVHIGPLGIFASPPVPWKNAFDSDDGAAQIGIKLGTLDRSANPSPCQPIHLTSRDSGGVDRMSEIVCDVFGNFVFRPGTAGAEIVLEDSAGRGALEIVPSGSAPYVSVDNQVRLGATGTVLVPALKSMSGARYVCVDAAGLFISSPTACSGT